MKQRSIITLTIVVCLITSIPLIGQLEFSELTEVRTSNPHAAPDYMCNGEPYSGKAIEKYKNGQIKLELTVVDGKANGPGRWYHMNGVLQKIVLFKDGLQEGVETLYHDNGKLRQVKYFEHGEPVGWWARYTPEGEPLKVYKD